MSYKHGDWSKCSRSPIENARGLQQVPRFREPLHDARTMTLHRRNRRDLTGVLRTKSNTVGP